MNWLAKISWINLRRHIGAFNGLLILAFVFPGIFYAGYRFGNFYHGYQENSLTQQQERLNSLYAQQEKQTQRINTLNLELELEKMAAKNSQALIKELENDNFSLKRELSFYERIMAPEKQVDGLVIESLEIEPTGSENHFRYRLVLVQQNKNKRFVRGRFDFQIEGNKDKKPFSISLSKLDHADANSQKFGFKYFQVSEGEMTLPMGFSPEKVTIKVILSKGKRQKSNELNQTVQWPS